MSVMVHRPVEDGLVFGKRVAALDPNARAVELDQRLCLLEKMFPEAADFLGLTAASSERQRNL